MTQHAENEWNAYCADELARVGPVARGLGYALDTEQVHTQGERFLQSGWKLVLTGTRLADGERVIVKASSRLSGMEELRDEHERRHILHRLDFAYLPFHSPQEYAFADRDGMTIAVTEFIPQETSFLQHSLQDQFFLALGAFKEQEGVHATTAAHARTIQSAFGMKDAARYVADFASFAGSVRVASPETGPACMDRASAFLNQHADIIDGYAGFLTHTDFVPHNFRVRDGIIYLLDHTSLTFGNKYESWARLANYMVIYNPELEQALADYIRSNRSKYEYLSFRLMRAYKLGYLLSFYATNLSKTEGDLRALSEERLRFWTAVTDAVLDDVPIPTEVVAVYIRNRDALRSEDEKARQRILGQL